MRTAHRCDRPSVPSLIVHLTAATLLGGALIGCGGGKQEPEVIPSQTMTRVTPQLEEPPSAPPIRELRPTKPKTVKVIDEGGDDSGQMSLVEASRLAKAEKRRAAEPIVEINDDNLAEYAEGGEIIIMVEEPAAPALELEPTRSAPEAAPPIVASDTRDSALEPLEPMPSPPSDGVRNERFWRSRALELRMGWRRTIDQLEGLELEAAALRQQFYAEENPYVRDSQIKPSWDRVLDRIDQLRDRSLRYEQEIELFVEDGRRSGAEQGWLNEGWELEPEAEEKERLEKFASHQPVNVPSPNETDNEP